MGVFLSGSGSVSRRYAIFFNISFLFVAVVFLIVCSVSSSEVKFPLSSGYRYPHSSNGGSSDEGCKELESLDDYKAKCFYLRSNDPCVSQGYVDYLEIFYCNFGEVPLLGHCVLFLWLLVLFYLLGSTASEYFCYSLESLSSLLKLSPTIAGVTLLSLGNGAPDVFASFVSFIGKGTSEIGLNTVLGGASFVTCVVLGTISLFIGKRHVQVNKVAFLRDVCCLLFVVSALILILLCERISLWSAIAFSSLYLGFVTLVYMTHMRGNSAGNCSSSSSCGSDLSIPILTGMESDELLKREDGAAEDGCRSFVKKGCSCLKFPACGVLLSIFELPLSLPRRLTIPVISEERWSRPYAIASATLAPILLSALLIIEYDKAISFTSLLTLVIGLLFSISFGVLAYLTTEKSNPPKTCLFPWLAGGFLMSVVWSYVTAQELVGLLVSLGYIVGVSASILGLTILAWGNSIGDLITNLTMALNNGSEGAQVAISGCYAGPIFNILFGLGLSLVFCCWNEYPSQVVIPKDYYLLETLGFLMAGLLWALIVLPWRDMKLDGVLGVGLLVIYLVSVSLRLIQALGSL